jgi:hypothetical protein
VQEVLSSKVGIAITGFITKQQLQAKTLERIVQNGSSDKRKYLTALNMCSINVTKEKV